MIVSRLDRVVEVKPVYILLRDSIYKITLYPLVESTWVTISYGSSINQFSLDTIKSIWQRERTFTKICRQNMYILFNDICINEEM